MDPQIGSQFIQYANRFVVIALFTVLALIVMVSIVEALSEEKE